MGGGQALLTDLWRSGRGDPGRPAPHHRLLFGGGKEKGAEDVLLYAWVTKYILVMMCMVSLFSALLLLSPNPMTIPPPLLR
ncbi:unnamed protein product [Triticum turgidum subsp. durum]|uniref:Uncharacterized protein n=1 Tax=Triticum turgidum subsp. durum TaxID=4567 RepID=A0A9R1RJP5_TRITD|nr:unnamed protein product [Triticum turgidum subsp. durum]